MHVSTEIASIVTFFCNFSSLIHQPNEKKLVFSDPMHFFASICAYQLKCDLYIWMLLKEKEFF